ncbi:MAG: periplasmic heavy metal sensor [Anaerolineaceae bacterium]|nr:periplasmic heavy metal sensor [Anaerolineaceae bacterium]
MKRLIILSAMVMLALLVVAAPAPAQDERPKDERKRTFGDQVGPRRPRFSMARFRQTLAKLDLTDEQKKKIDQLSKDYKKKVAEQRKETAEKVKELREKQEEAREAGDKEKLAELRQEFRQLRTAGAETAKEYVESVKEVLTGEQKKKLEELQRPVPRIRVLLQVIREKDEEMGLTEEQQKKIKALAEEYKPQEGEGRPPDFRALREKTRKMRDDGASQEEIRKVYKEAQKKRLEHRARMERHSREFVARLAKILKPEQMKLAMEAAQANMGHRMRGRGRDREPGGEPPRRNRRGDSQE